MRVTYIAPTSSIRRFIENGSYTCASTFHHVTYDNKTSGQFAGSLFASREDVCLFYRPFVRPIYLCAILYSNFNYILYTRLGASDEHTRFDHIPEKRVWFSLVYNYIHFVSTLLRSMKLIPFSRAGIGPEEVRQYGKRFVKKIIGW